MPSQILHTMFGEDVLSVVGSAQVKEKVFRDYRGAFILGCQGPDIFYHSQRHKPVAIQYGSLLHRRKFGVFSACLLRMGLSGAEINAHGAYALGFVTHALLDRACHPYIIYHCGENYHSFFERVIDVLMLKELRGLEPYLWDQEKILAAVCENPPPGLKELIACCLAAAFPEKAKSDRSLARRIDNAFIDSARFYNMSSPSRIAAALSSGSSEKLPVFTRRALNYVYPENLPAEIDFLNLKHGSWRYPHIPAGGEIIKDDNRSLPEIYSDTVKFAVDALVPCVMQYFQSGAFPPDAAERIGNNGLSIQDEEGRPCAPNFTDPLPLEQVMEQQRKYRGVE